MKRYCDELASLRASETGKQALVAMLMAREAGETPAARPRPHRPALRAALIAAAVAALLAVGALAAELGVWQRFFLGSGGDAVTPVGVSAVTGDYTLTLEESIVDEDEATFLLALTRTDGGVLEGEPRLDGNILNWDVKVDGQYPNMGTTCQDPILSEDGKAVYYCLAFSDESLEDRESLIGREITFVCKGVADMNWTEADERVRMEAASLAPMAEAAVETTQNWEELTAEGFGAQSLEILEQVGNAALPLALGDGQAAQVAGVIFTADGPAVAVNWLIDRCWQDNYLAVEGVPYLLTDTRTGESWGMNGFLRFGDSPETYLSRFPDCPLTAEDLPYLELTVRYQMEKVLSDQRVELTFRTEKGGGVTKTVDQDVSVDYISHYEGTLTDVRISALGLRLDMEDITIAGHIEDSTSAAVGCLVMEDGTELTLRGGGNYLDTDRGRGHVELRPQDANGNRALIDPQAVQTLILGDCEIDLTA